MCATQIGLVACDVRIKCCAHSAVFLYHADHTDSGGGEGSWHPGDLGRAWKVGRPREAWCPSG